MQVKRSCVLPEDGQVMDARGGVGGGGDAARSAQVREPVAVDADGR